MASRNPRMGDLDFHRGTKHQESESQLSPKKLNPLVLNKNVTGNNSNSMISPSQRKGPLVAKLPWEIDGRKATAILKPLPMKYSNSDPTLDETSSKLSLLKAKHTNFTAESQYSNNRMAPPSAVPSKTSSKSSFNSNGYEPPQQVTPKTQISKPQQSQPQQQLNGTLQKQVKWKQEEEKPITPRISEPSFEANEEEDTGERAQCAMCERYFAVDRLEKHQKICKKVSEKAAKRKVFDSTKARVDGTEAAAFVAKAKKEEGKKKQEPPKRAKPKWKRDHEQFQAAMKSVKGDGSEPSSARNFNPSNDEPPEDDGMVACPHCGRKFNDTAATRHIPICQKVFSNKGAKPRGATTAAPKTSAKPAPAPARKR